MIKVTVKEYLENDKVGVYEKTVKFLDLTVYRYIKTTTNATVVAKFKGVKPLKVKGYEIKD